jgi:hypothetical protein
MRIFLTNYFRNGSSAADINDLDGGPIASARQLIDDEIGVETSDLTYDEINHLRPHVYINYAMQLSQDQFLKVHDMNSLNGNGLRLFPSSVTAGVIYIIRNPLSVAPSLAMHSGIGIDQAIENMGGRPTKRSINFVGLNAQVAQNWSSWSQHVTSWVDDLEMRILVIRYEDMKQQPFKVFGTVIQFAGLDINDDRIKKAIKFSSFETLQAQEIEQGFKERLKSSSFFRKGEIASWRAELTPKQIDRIILDHASVMKRFGYLSADELPLDMPLPMKEFSYAPHPE